MEVVRAGLGGERRACPFQLPQRGERVARRVMHDVRPRPRLGAEAGRQRHRLVLRRARTATKIGTILSWISLDLRRHRLGNFCVHQQPRRKARELMHRRPQIVLGHPAELLDARIDQEALEPEHTGGGHRLELAEIPRHDAAPESHVDAQLAPRRFALAPKSGQRRRDRNRIQRHIDDSSNPARRRRFSRAAKSFPFGASRLVDVHVGVDHSGHHQRIAAIDHFRDRSIVSSHRRDAPVLDQHRRRLHAFGSQHALAADDPHQRARTIFAAPHPSSTSTAKTCQLYSLP